MTEYVICEGTVSCVRGREGYVGERWVRDPKKTESVISLESDTDVDISGSTMTIKGALPFGKNFQIIAREIPPDEPAARKFKED